MENIVSTHKRGEKLELERIIWEGGDEDKRVRGYKQVGKMVAN